MDITIKVEDYITPEEIKALAMEAIREVIFKTFYRDEAGINRLISNLSYEFIFKAVSDAIGENAEARISDKVKELLEDTGTIRYELWRRKSNFEKCDSPAVEILNEAIKDNKSLIRSKVEEGIRNFEFDDIQTAMYEALSDVVYNMVYNKSDK